MGVRIDIEYAGALRCRAIHGPSGSIIETDAPVDNGGQGAAFSPTDLVATALGTCIVTILGKIAERRELELRGTRVCVVKEMVQGTGRRIASLQVTILFPEGVRLDAEERARLENGAATCPVKRSLHPEVAIEIRYEYPGPAPAGR
jgi:putative redox protein